MRCLRCIVQVYPKRMLVFRSVTITKVGNVEDSWCISLVDDKTQQSSSPPHLDMYCVTSNNSQNIANMCKTTLCATILLFCFTIGHSLVQVQCGAQGLRTNCGLSSLSTPLTKIFNTCDKDFQHHSWDEDSFQCCTQSSGHNRLSASWSTSSKYDLRLADEES